MKDRDTLFSVSHVTESRTLILTQDTTQAATQALRFLAFADQLSQHPFPVASGEHRQALLALVRLCVRHHQTALLVAPVLGDDDGPEGDPFNSLFFGALDEEGQDFHDLAQLVPYNAPVNLSDGLIWTAPWEPEHYRRALLRSGPGWYERAWAQQDDQDGTVYLPWGLYCVGNGNHSAASGILRGDGQLTPEETFDLRLVLERVDLNEHGLIRVDTGALVATSTDWPVLALIGLGKRLLEVAL